MINIKISEEHDAAGCYLLMTNGSTVKCLPDNVYLVNEEQLTLLDQHKIHYEKMREEIVPQEEIFKPESEIQIL